MFNRRDPCFNVCSYWTSKDSQEIIIGGTNVSFLGYSDGFYKNIKIIAQPMIIGRYSDHLKVRPSRNTNSSIMNLKGHSCLFSLFKHLKYVVLDIINLPNKAKYSKSLIP